MMQSLSKYNLFRLTASLISIGLISSAITMELLPEEEAKVYVVPILVAALFSSLSYTLMYKKY